ncbi:unnamed protein product [Arabidopsis lyrata]|nr:unnamed protein product [Arabidopsis lyrata]
MKLTLFLWAGIVFCLCFSHRSLSLTTVTGKRIPIHPPSQACLSLIIISVNDVTPKSQTSSHDKLTEKRDRTYIYDLSLRVIGNKGPVVHHALVSCWRKNSQQIIDEIEEAKEAEIEEENAKKAEHPRKPSLPTKTSSGRNRSRVNEPYWAEIYAKGNTGVFWDLVDFPIPECDPYLISKNIKSTLEDKGCQNGPVSIQLYQDEKNLLPKELIDKYEAAGISINFVPDIPEAYGYARDHKMLVDILRWAVDSPMESNLIVLSKNLKEELTVCVIQGLHDRGYNVLLAVPTEEIPFTESSAWLWDGLCASRSSQHVDNKADTVAVADSV